MIFHIFELKEKKKREMTMKELGLIGGKAWIGKPGTEKYEKSLKSQQVTKSL